MPRAVMQLHSKYGSLRPDMKRPVVLNGNTWSAVYRHRTPDDAVHEELAKVDIMRQCLSRVDRNVAIFGCDLCLFGCDKGFNFIKPVAVSLLNTPAKTCGEFFVPDGCVRACVVDANTKTQVFSGDV